MTARARPGRGCWSVLGLEQELGPGAALAALVAALTATGCYQPRALDARTVLRELPPAEAGAGDGRAMESRGSRPSATPAAALTEDAAVVLALRSNPDLRMLRDQRGIAEGEVVAAGALANPTVAFDLIHLEDWGAQRAWALSLGWEPPQPAVYAARRAAARAGAEAVDAELAEAAWQIAAAVRAAHASLLAIAEKRALVDREVGARQRIVELVRARVAGGASTRLDLGVAALAVAQVERESDELAAQEIAAAAALGQLLGTAPAHAIAGDLFDDPRPPPALDALVEETLAARPALAAEERRYRQREETVRLERARRWPWFRFTAVPRYRADGSDVHPHDFSAGVEVSVPIFNLNRGPIQIAEATRDQEHEAFGKLVGGVRRELASAREEIALRGEALRRYVDEVLPGLETQERLLAKAVAGGQIDIVALTTAEDLILRSRSTYIDLRLACYRAWIDLDRTVGRRLSPAAAAVPAPP